MENTSVPIWYSGFFTTHECIIHTLNPGILFTDLFFFSIISPLLHFLHRVHHPVIMRYQSNVVHVIYKPWASNPEAARENQVATGAEMEIFPDEILTLNNPF